MSFKSALQKYEQKEYQKALDELNTVIENNPKNGESLALKGLCHLSLAKEDKGEDFIKRGLELSPQNSIAFHIAGIWYKIEKRYKEAYSAYAKSYLLDQENINVQQDLGMLAMNERNWKLTVEVRRRFLRNRPHMHVAWTCLAVAQHQAKDYAGGIQTLNLYLDLLASERSQAISKPVSIVKSDLEKIEVSETLLYVNDLMSESGDNEGALKHLRENESKIWDKLAYETKLAQLLTATGDAAATKAWLDLVHRNPNCAQYYEQLEDLIPLDSTEKLVKFYENMRAVYPEAEFPKQRPLFFLEELALEDYAVEYMNDKITRGVPALFALIKPMYRATPDAIVSAVGKLDPKPDSFAYNLFMAKHLSFKGDQDDALKYAKAAGESAEAQLTVARILTRKGDFKGAAELAKKVSDADRGDRFLNSKAVKYALLAGDFELANKVAADFPTRSNESSDGLKYMVEFEGVDYLSRAATSYSLFSDHMMALKRAENVHEIFKTAYDHQYDFHYFAPRRGSLRAYHQLVDWVDNLYTHPRYEEAVIVLLDEYVQVATGAPDGIPAATKDALLKEREEAAKNPKNEDKDPWGTAYASPAEPLESAIAAWKPLSEARPNNSRTWQIIMPVYLAQKKYVFAVQAIKKAKEFGASDAWVAYAGLLASNALAKDEAAPVAIRTLQLKMLTAMCPGDLSADLKQYADTYITDNKLWMEARLALGEHDGVEAKLAQRLGNAVHARNTLLYLRRYGLGDKEYSDAIKAAYPDATFV